MAARGNPNKSIELSDEEKTLVRNVMPNYVDDIVQTGPKKIKTFRFYPKYCEEIYNFPIRQDDVWVVSLPRSGTTVTQELVWQICNNCNFQKGFKTPLVERFPFFEYPMILDESRISKLLQENNNDLEKCARIKKVFALPWEATYDPLEPRFFKTHLALSLLPNDLLSSGCKVIYIARNPKDCFVSRYNFFKMNGRAVPEKFEDFWMLIEKGLLNDLPFMEHITEAWNLRNSSNVLFLFYENLINDMDGTIKKTAQFLGKEIRSVQISQLVDHLSIDNFRKNESVNRDYSDFFPVKEKNHVRKGKVGTWKEELFTDNLNKRADKWIAEQYSKTDLRFPGL